MNKMCAQELYRLLLSLTLAVLMCPIILQIPIVEIMSIRRERKCCVWVCIAVIEKR